MSVLPQAWGVVVLVLRLPMLLGVLVPSRIARALTVQLMHLWSTCADVAPVAVTACLHDARRTARPTALSRAVGPRVLSRLVHVRGNYFDSRLRRAGDLLLEHISTCSHRDTFCGPRRQAERAVLRSAQSRRSLLQPGCEGVTMAAEHSGTMSRSSWSVSAR